MKLFSSILLLSLFFYPPAPKQKAPAIPAPLFIDPNYHGSCDPEVVFNAHDRLWYVYYTARRSSKGKADLGPSIGVISWWLGSPIGVISSRDFVHWTFRGYCKFDGIGGVKDANASFWAPGIVRYGNKLHMFVTWKPDTIPVRGPWGGPGIIRHYEAPVNNPVNGWKLVGAMSDTTSTSLDATVYRIDDVFHLWYKRNKKHSGQFGLFETVSRDMVHWEDKGFNQSDAFNKSVTGSDFEEAPYVFKWKGYFWLITDPHLGLFVYRSDDAEHWKFQGAMLLEGGSRDMDASRARHCSVAVVGDRAFLIYHVEPWRDYSKPPFLQPIKNRESALQMAELKYGDGKISCDRDARIPPLLQ